MPNWTFSRCTLMVSVNWDSSAMRAPSTQTSAKEPDRVRFACKLLIRSSSFHVLSDGYMEMTSARSSMASQKVSLASKNT